MILRWPALLLPLLLAAYGTLYFTLDQKPGDEDRGIPPSFPVPVLEFLGHSYLSQCMAEALFIKAAVYYGGLKRMPDEGNLEILAQHFATMSRLHPLMLDTYYRAEGVLAHRGEVFTHKANSILEAGRSSLPDIVALPFFEGFNYDHYLGQPARAAEIMLIASRIEGAPRWIGHLASLLAAEGGNIRSGLVWLIAMQASSNDNDEKLRYGKEIGIFERGLLVQNALEQYIRNVGKPPAALSELVPGYVTQIPQLDDGYRLEYNRPNLYLKRDRL